MDTVKIAVYGTLMRGERNNRFCARALKVTPCTLTGTLYDTGCGFPAFEPEGTDTIAAELVELPSYGLQTIDWLEGYPRLYDRRMCKVTLESGETDEAWVYIMNLLPPGSAAITSGDWRAYRKARKIY